MGSPSEAVPPASKIGFAGSGCLGLFGASFAVAGLLFAAFVARDFFQTVAARGWDKVPATLTAAYVEVAPDKEDPFSLRTRFAYQIDGREYLSEKFARKEKWSDNYEKLALQGKALRSKEDLVAYVDPGDRATAVLDPGSLASGFLILFPLVFVAVGVALIYGAIRNARRAKNLNSIVEAISSKPTKRSAGAAAGVVVGALFALAGLGTLYPLGIKPIARSVAAKDWVETPCKIIWAKVKSHDSEDGTTYSVDVFYSYTVKGEEHRSNRYGFIGGSSSGREKKKEVVNRYKRAEAPVCYVDPDVPERAVLKRELGAAGLLALIPVGLLLIGAPLTVTSLRAKGRSGAGRGAESKVGLPATSRGESAAAEQTFSPGKKRLSSALILLLVGLFWNGMVFGFLFREAWLGNGGLFLKLFSIPFMAVGVVIALGFISTTLALFNPRPILTLAPGEPQLGVRARLSWQFKGSAGRLRRLQIVLRGFEHASYQRGTDTVTDERTFYAVLLTDQAHAMNMHQGTVEITIPHDLMYSLELEHNAIRWRLEVRGDVPFWPDVDDQFEIVVRPHPVT